MNNSKKIKTITFTGISIALVTLLTMLIRVPVIGTKGYVNFGDIAIFIVAAIIGKRTGFLAGSFGSAIADCIGYPIYAPGTFVIKGIEGLICALLIKKNSNGSLNKISVIIAAAVSGIWMVVGYFIYEYFLFGWAVAYASIPGNLTQGLVSAVAAWPIIIAVYKTSKKFVIE